MAATQSALSAEAKAKILRNLEGVLNASHLLSRPDCPLEQIAHFCSYLTRMIDIAVLLGDTPAVAHRIPGIVMEVFKRRNEPSLQPSLLMLMISVKNACQKGWFDVAVAGDLHKMINELRSEFCMNGITTNEATATNEVTDVSALISKVNTRYFPHLELCRLFASFEVKPGYDIVVADFHIERGISPGGIRLFIAQTDSLESSSCIVSPPDASFLVNGKAVEKRCNISKENGAQFPTDISKMIKRGTNIIQAVGYFGGNYAIAIASMRNLTLAPSLEEYIQQPVTSSLNSDADVIEGPSIVSLNCPISCGRIKTPVKGHLCKHRQCFDYDTYTTLNLKKPSWRCPCCNQSVSFTDIRIDKNMVKVLAEAGENTSEVMISCDGLWNSIKDHDTTNTLCNRTVMSNEDGKLSSTFHNLSSSGKVVVDLTAETINADDASSSPGNLSPENEDTKPFKDGRTLPVLEGGSSHLLANRMTEMRQSDLNGIGLGSGRGGCLSRCIPNESTVSVSQSNCRVVGTLESLIPEAVLNPVVTDAVSSAIYGVSTSNHEAHGLNPYITRQLRPGNIYMQEQHDMRNSHGRSFAGSDLPGQLPSGYTETSVQMQRIDPNQQSYISLAQNTPSFLYNNTELQGTQVGLNTLNSDFGVPLVERTFDRGSLSSPLNSLGQVGGYLENGNLLNVQCQGSAASQLNCGSRMRMELQNGLVQQALSNANSAGLRSSVSMLDDCFVRSREQMSFLPSSAKPSSRFTADVSRQAYMNLFSDTATATLASSGSTDILTSPENWYPEGRMRGSLTGNNYTAAINLYAAQPSQIMSARPSITSQVASSYNYLPCSDMQATAVASTYLQVSNGSEDVASRFINRPRPMDLMLSSATASVPPFYNHHPALHSIGVNGQNPLVQQSKTMQSMNFNQPGS